MKANKRMKKHLIKAKRVLARYKRIDSPVIYVTAGKGKQRRLRIRPTWQDSRTKDAALSALRELCREVDAKEIITVSNTYGYNKNSQIPDSEALLVTVENRDGIKAVYLPYSFSADGQVIFGDEEWTTKKVEVPEGRLEGLVL